MTINLPKSLIAATLPFTLFFGSAPVFAQDVALSENTYTPAFFESYAPRTALDMVSRIPGFQINGADNKRGLGQGGANIL
ncbi:MAG: hypothetical protein ACPGVT_09490, partial [Maricaulaceae bacterium]